jgi:hypothetical protein
MADDVEAQIAAANEMISRAVASIPEFPEMQMPAGVTAMATAHWFSTASERVEVTYSVYVSPEEAFVNSLTDDGKRALNAAAEEGARLGGTTRDEMLGALVRALANCGSTGVAGD